MDEAPAPEQLSLSDPITLPSGAVYGVKFLGWFAGPYGESIKAENGMLVNRLFEGATTKTEDSFNLIASYKVITYTITRDMQGGTLTSCKAIKKTYSQNRMIDSCNNAKKTGYTLEGWYTSPNGEGLKITTTMKVKEVIKYLELSENVSEFTIYANWTPNS